jgi:hypothetical protein
MFSLKQFIRDIIREFTAPDAPPGTFMIVRHDEILTRPPNGVMLMHVKLTVGIPLLTSHEKGQGVKTRNFMAIRGGDEDNPVLVLNGQDALRFSEAVIDNLQYGDRIDLRMFNVDQSGNISLSPLDGIFVLTDTTPPDAPAGSFTINTVEVADPGDEAEAPPVVATPVNGGGEGGGEGSGFSSDSGDASSPPPG